MCSHLQNNMFVFYLAFEQHLLHWVPCVVVIILIIIIIIIISSSSSSSSRSSSSISSSNSGSSCSSCSSTKRFLKGKTIYIQIIQLSTVFIVLIAHIS